MNDLLMTEVNRLSQVKEDLEAMLVAMCYFGKPRLNKMKDGWHCVCEMHVADKGTSFEVRSEFNEDTPIQAVRVCMKRIKETLAKYGVKT